MTLKKATDAALEAATQLQIVANDLGDLIESVPEDWQDGVAERQVMAAMNIAIDAVWDLVRSYHGSHATDLCISGHRMVAEKDRIHRKKKGGR